MRSKIRITSKDMVAVKINGNNKNTYITLVATTITTTMTMAMMTITTGIITSIILDRSF